LLPFFRLVFNGHQGRFSLPAERGAHETSHPTVLLAISVFFFAPVLPEAPTGFDNKSNGLVDDATHTADQVKFDEIEEISEGLGPLYNAQSCASAIRIPLPAAPARSPELRVGHRGPDGKFQNPEIPIARGAEIIKGRTLVNDRAICPNAAFPARKFRNAFQIRRRFVPSAFL